jgi:hypothetical protein
MPTSPPARLRFQPERRGEQRAGVVGLRILEQLGGRALLHHLAMAHHDQMAGERGDHAQIVGNEHVGEVALALQFAQQIDHMGLEQHVERAGRLVHTTKFGSSTAARAIEMRWRWPPENSCG